MFDVVVARVRAFFVFVFAFEFEVEELKFVVCVFGCVIGVYDVEDVLDVVFCDFCVGK